MVFGNPVFSSLTTIDPNQKAKLVQLAKTILEADPRAMIMVIGHTDNDPIRPSSKYKSNEYLSELRANAVIEFLRASNLPPGAQLRPVAVGADSPPFPNDNAADKARNRTVTLEIMVPVS